MLKTYSIRLSFLGTNYDIYNQVVSGELESRYGDMSHIIGKRSLYIDVA